MTAIGADEIFRIGGFMFSRTSVSVKAQGVPFTGIFDINGEESREGELVHGQRNDGTPLGVTSGLYMPGPVTFKAYVDSGQMLCEQLAAQGLGSFGNVLWNLTLEIFENPALPTLTFNWRKVKIEKRKFGVPTDTGALATEFECKHQGLVVVGVGAGLTGIPTLLANAGGITVPAL